MINIKTKIELKQWYETDENLWLEETIRLLKENCLEELYLENLIEELESLLKQIKIIDIALRNSNIQGTNS